MMIQTLKRFFKNVRVAVANPAAFRAGLDYTLYQIRKNDFSRLAAAFGSDKGFGRHGYSRVYDALLGPMRQQPIAVLELGLLQHNVQRAIGGSAFTDAPSLRMLAEYFPKGRIFGFDIQDFSGFSHERCTVFRGDQAERSDLQAFLATVGVDAFDVIVDDALHASRHQQISMGVLFERLKPGGLYFVEDLHYQPAGFEAPTDRLTLDLLEQLRAGKGFKSPVLSADEIAYIERHTARVRIFDTLKPKHETKFALAVLEKCRDEV